MADENLEPDNHAVIIIIDLQDTACKFYRLPIPHDNLHDESNVQLFAVIGSEAQRADVESLLTANCSFSNKVSSEIEAVMNEIFGSGE